MTTATTTRLEWRVVRKDYYLETTQEEPGGLTMCDSGPTPTAIIRSGRTNESIDAIKLWEAKQPNLRLYVDREADEDERDSHFDGSNFVLQVLVDGNWETIKMISPFDVTSLEQCTECSDWHSGDDPDLCEKCLALNPCAECNSRKEGIQKDGHCADCTRYYTERFGG